MLGLWLRQKSRPYGILHKLKGKKIINKRPLLIRDSRVILLRFLPRVQDNNTVVEICHGKIGVSQKHCYVIQSFETLKHDF